MLRHLCHALALCLLLPLAAGAADTRSELVVSYSSGRLEFDPNASISSTEAQVFTALYEGLFTYNPASLEPERAAARSFTRSRDGKTYTFVLRDDARWSNGDKLVAAHFRDAWLRMLEPGRDAPYAAFFDLISGARDYRLGLQKDSAKVGIKALSESTLEVKLEQPAAYFTRLLCHHSFSPIHPSMLAKADWDRDAPAIPTNGPFRVASYSDDELVMVRNESYWDSASLRLSSIRVPFIDEDAEATRRYNNGEIHWMAGGFDLDGLLARDEIQAGPLFATHYWFFRSDRAPWDKSEVRRALALLLPWGELRDAELYGIIAESLVLPFEGYEAPKGISTRDEGEAFELLAKAGYPEGKGLKPIRIMIPDGEDARRVATLMATAWKKSIGLETVINAVSANRFFEEVKSADYDMSLTSWIGDFADPLAFLQMWISDSNLNDARWRSKAYDALIARSNGQEAAERFKTLAEAEGLLLREAAVLPLYHSLAINVVNPAVVDGWVENLLDIHPFKALGFGAQSILPGVTLVPRGQALSRAPLGAGFGPESPASPASLASPAEAPKRDEGGLR